MCPFTNEETRSLFTPALIPLLLHTTHPDEAVFSNLRLSTLPVLEVSFAKT